MLEESRETCIHFAGLETVEVKHEWGGCNLIDHAGSLWRVRDAVNGLTRVDVYAYRLSKELESRLRSEFAAWTDRRGEEAND